MDIAIIGAGTCGLYLAWKLSQAGHKVVVFEKKKTIAEIGQKPCSSLISERLGEFIPLNDSLIENKIDTCFLHFPRKTITLSIKPTHFAIDRLNLVKILFGLARKAGAEILFGQTIKKIPQGFDRVIGCDGALSQVREQLGLRQPLFRLGLQVFQDKRDNSNYVETWPIKAGFFWKIPRGERTEYGAIGPLKTIKKDFDEFLSRNFSRAALEKSYIKSALIPQGLHLPRQQNITLCGDAAGLTKPWSGGGVIWGLTAAEILLKNFPDFQKYRQETQALFKTRFLKAKLTLPFVYSLGFHFPYFLPSKISIDNDLLQRAGGG